MIERRSLTIAGLYIPLVDADNTFGFWEIELIKQKKTGLKQPVLMN